MRSRENANVVVNMRRSNISELSNLPATISWTNINVCPPKPTCCFAPRNVSKLKKPILNGVDGLAKPYEVLAVLGSSGSGKTTLLNVLNFRKMDNLKVAGEIRINGKQINSVDEMIPISGYVQQDDLFICYLTVKEHLIFQAMLRMDKNLTKEERLGRVNEVLRELNLEKCENNVIGIFGTKGISGGEKKRLSFASEIITNPSILYFDEPTSGLDSLMAVSIVDCMKSLANKGKTIICTIHQPSSEIYEKFDKICLLTDGCLAYMGDLNNAKEFFKSQGFVLPLNYNPADFYIKIVSTATSNKEISPKTIKKICANFEISHIKADIDNQITEVKNLQENLNRKQNFSYKSNFWTQLRWLLWRNILGLLREPFFLKIQLLQTILVGMLFGLVYFQLKYDQQGVMDINGFMFLSICNNGIATIFFVVATFPLEQPVFYKDHENGLYRAFSYYLARILSDVPNFTILPIIFVLITYWMAGLVYDFNRFLIYLAVIILVVHCSLAFATFLSILAPSTNVALALAGPLIVPIMIFSGYLLNNDSIPVYFVWLKYLSWFSYANELLVINQWESITKITCPANITVCYDNGQQIIDYLRIDKKRYYINIICLLAIIVVWRVLAYIALEIKARNRKKNKYSSRIDSFKF